MTLIVGLHGKDAIVVASDSRAYFKDEKKVTCHDDNSKKIYIVRNVAICGAGAAYTNKLVDEIEKTTKVGVTDIMNEITRVANETFDEWFPDFPLFPLPNQSPDFVRPRLELSIAGYDLVETQSTRRIYIMNSAYRFVSVRYDDRFSVSGVPQYARCLLDLLYSENMETEVLERLAAYVITKTKTQNDEVGGRVQMVTITPGGAIRLEDEKINSIILENEDRAKKLKEIFIL